MTQQCTHLALALIQIFLKENFFLKYLSEEDSSVHRYRLKVIDIYG